MTIINTQLHQNSLLQSNQTSIPSLSSENSNISSIYSSNLYLGSGSTNVPGLTNIFFAPYDLYHELNALSAAYKIDDREGVVENGLRVIEAPFSISNAFMKLSVYAINAGTFFKTLDNPNFAPILAISSPLSKLIALTGFVICVIEGVFEFIGLIYSADLYKDIYMSEIEGPKETQENIRHLFLSKLYQEYFQIQSEEMKEIDNYVKNKLSEHSTEEQNKRKNFIIQANLDLKKSALIRRIQPWLANQIEETLPQILTDLQSAYKIKADQAKEKAESLFNNVKIQTEKNMLIHSVGVFAVLFTIAGLIAECVLLHFMVPTLLLLIGGALAIARGMLYLGLKDSEGWNFSVEKCIPDTIKEIYSNIVAENLTIKNEPSYTLSYSFVLPGSEYDLALRNYQASVPKFKFPTLEAQGIGR